MHRYFDLDGHPPGLYKVIADTIINTYPEGLMPDEPEYHQYEGIKRFDELVGDNIIHKTGTIARAWRQVLQHIARELPGEIRGTTYGPKPGLSADLILEKYQDEVLIRIKRVAFAVSLIGPLYTVCGVDETFICEKGEPGMYHAINRVTASPFKEFEHPFNFIQRAIKAECSGYKFVPFEVAMKFVKNLHTTSYTGEQCTVYNALFNHLFDYYYHWRSRGNRFYGMERNPHITAVKLTPPPPLEQ